MTNLPSDNEELLGLFDRLKAGMREVTHDINNPIGIIRMAVYFLQTSDASKEKQAQYFTVINDSLDKMEQVLKKFKAMRETLPGSTEQPAGKDPR